MVENYTFGKPKTLVKAQEDGGSMKSKGNYQNYKGASTTR